MHHDCMGGVWGPGSGRLRANSAMAPSRNLLGSRQLGLKNAFQEHVIERDGDIHRGSSAGLQTASPM